MGVGVGQVSGGPKGMGVGFSDLSHGCRRAIGRSERRLSRSVASTGSRHKSEMSRAVGHTRDVPAQFVV